jgi:hypothetical protein
MGKPQKISSGEIETAPEGIFSSSPDYSAKKLKNEKGMC